MNKNYASFNQELNRQNESRFISYRVIDAQHQGIAASTFEMPNLWQAQRESARSVNWNYPHIG
jgi:hypothetical protein